MLKDLHINEIAFCSRGMNPEARMLIYKRRDDAALISKEDDDEPPTFDEAFGSARAMEIDGALDRRLFSLLDVTTAIMRSDVDNREELILQAVNDYAATMARDVPDLFAGRLAKILTEWADDGDGGDESLHSVIKAELQTAGLLGDSQGDTTMKFLDALTKAERTALDYVLGGTSAEDFFKGVTDEVGAFVVGLAKRAVAATDSESQLEKTREDLAKALGESGNETQLETLLKSVTDPGVRAYLETQAAAVRKSGEEITALRKQARDAAFTVFAKSVPHLPNPESELIELLGKAEDAGIRDEVEKVLVAANEHAKVAKAFEELGLETVIGDGTVGTPAEAHEALVAKAAEIKKAQPEITAEKAYTMALEQNPDLYQQTRGVAQ